jgi:hypothetical protein
LNGSVGGANARFSGGNRWMLRANGCAQSFKILRVQNVRVGKSSLSSQTQQDCDLQSCKLSSHGQKKYECNGVKYPAGIAEPFAEIAMLTPNGRYRG